MSNVIDFIEQWGQQARWRAVTGEVMEAALLEAGFDADERAAILAPQPGLLESMIGARPNVCCLVNVPDDDEQASEQKSA
jgi:hypothetical protein